MDRRGSDSGGAKGNGTEVCASRWLFKDISILQDWDSISKVEIVNGIDWRTREYFEGLMKNKADSTDIPEENS